MRIPKDDIALRRRLEELAAERRRFGFRRLAVLLRREGIVVKFGCVIRSRSSSVKYIQSVRYYAGVGVIGRP